MSGHSSSPPPREYVPARAPGEPSARNGLGTAALVLGLAGSVMGLVWSLFWLAAALGVFALALGLAGRGRTTRGRAANRDVTTFGAVLGLIALALSGVGAMLLCRAAEDTTGPPADTSHRSIEARAASGPH
ncbi:hypothetical protein [Streptomyces sp. NPDC014734]|uniref:hypothetical protein n=1 Tax=Streptomyces sp. NPDC014734 TaxID=3364886 RepID=UPI0036FAA41A